MNWSTIELLNKASVFLLKAEHTERIDDRAEYLQFSQAYSLLAIAKQAPPEPEMKG